MPPVKKPEPEKENSERWLLTYADMITLLLALFVVLYASSTITPSKFVAVADSLQQAFHGPLNKSSEPRPALPIASKPNSFTGLTSMGTTIGPELVGYAEKQELGDQVTVTATKDSVIISLAGSLIFGSGSAELRPEGQQFLEFISGTLRDLPDKNPVRVEGHTDTTPTGSTRFLTNWDLSTARAAAAARVLAEHGIAAERLIVAGYADSQPIADNNTPEGRTRNRRVDLRIMSPAAATN
ncbi:MAG: OmpA family protein [Chloroflexi bacterium]|nr:OmpA family protein [Chloroflexota bacterium]